MRVLPLVVAARAACLVLRAARTFSRAARQRWRRCSLWQRWHWLIWAIPAPALQVACWKALRQRFRNRARQRLLIRPCRLPVRCLRLPLLLQLPPQLALLRLRLMCLLQPLLRLRQLSLRSLQRNNRTILERILA